jgi:serine protease inhibitor
MATGTAASLRDFAAELFAVLATEPGNVACSPYSIALALAMTRNGARGTTATELDRVLHASGPEQINRGMNALQLEFAARSEEFRHGGVALAVASSLWGQRSEPWQAPFLADLARYYDAGMHTVDYRANAEGARRDINGWISRHTHDRIRELVRPGAVDNGTRLVLANALYFKAPWRSPFRKDGTCPAPFTRPDGSRVEVPMMGGVRVTSGYREGPGWQAVRLPYLGGKLAMTVLVPEAGHFDRVQRGLSGPALGDLLTGPSDGTAVVVELPRWTFRHNVELTDALTALGMATAFTDEADFSAMTAAERLSIGRAVHEAYVAVDEEGTEAAAATGVTMEWMSAPARTVQLTVDRPFLFVIHDIDTATPLFLGRVTDPST